MPMEYNKDTDAEHKIKLDSELVYAVWRVGRARAGQMASFEVGTAFVGNGSKIKIKGKTEGGDNLGKVSGKMRNNKFIGELEILDDVELDDAAYFEVELSQVGLSDESNRIPTAPPVVVSNLKWSATEARRGDVMKLTADVEGCEDDTEAKITIFEYDEDKVHDRIVELPGVVKENKIEIFWEYEYHEDVDEVPTDEELKKYGKSYNPPEYFFVIEIDGQKFGREQESGLLTFKDYIEIDLKNQYGEPAADEKYKITLPDGTEKEGNLDDNGYARIDDVPPGKYEIEFPDIGPVDTAEEDGDESVNSAQQAADADDDETEDDTGDDSDSDSDSAETSG